MRSIFSADNKKAISAFRYTLTAGLSTFLSAIVGTQFIGYLISLKLNMPTRSLILSAIATSSIILELIVGYMVDKIKNIKVIAITLMPFLLISALLTYRYNNNNILYFITISCLMGALNSTYTELIEVWFYQLGRNYNIYRASMSLGWAIGSFIIGGLIVRFDYKIISFIAPITIVSLIVFCILLPNTAGKSQGKTSIRGVFLLLRNKKYLQLILIYFWVFFVMEVDGIAVIELILGTGNAESVGVKFALAAMTEIPFFIVSRRLMGGKNEFRILRFLLVIKGLLLICYAFSKTPLLFYLIAMIGGGVFPFFNVLQHDLVNKLVPDNLKSSGQMMLTAINSTIPSIIAPFIIGVFVYSIGLRGLLILVGFSATLPLILLNKILNEE